VLLFDLILLRVSGARLFLPGSEVTKGTFESFFDRQSRFVSFGSGGKSFSPAWLAGLGEWYGLFSFRFSYSFVLAYLSSVDLFAYSREKT